MVNERFARLAEDGEGEESRPINVGERNADDGDHHRRRRNVGDDDDDGG